MTEVYHFNFSRVWFLRSAVINFVDYLRDFINKPVQFLEIGCYEGMSAWWMCCKILTHPKSHLVCIDSWKNMDDIYERFQYNMKEIPDHKFDVYRFPSDIILPRLNLNLMFDFVYIDGYHKYNQAYRDLVNCWSLVKPRGVVAIDDYRWSEYDVKSDVDQFLLEHKSALEIVNNGYQLWIRKKF